MAKINIEKEEIYEGEIIETEGQEMIPAEPEATEATGMSTGTAMLIGAGIAAGAFWLGKKARKAWNKRKARKAAEAAAEADETDYEEEPADDSEEA
jgi:hypothetical protein